MSTMFDTLLKLPLFQGISQENFTSILGKVKLHFNKYKAGDLIAKSGTPCSKLVFLLNGEIESEFTPTNNLFTYAETIKTAYLIEPEALFGMNPIFKATYKAKTETGIMTIEKAFVLNELLRYEIFRLNYVNNISSRLQTLHNRIWDLTTRGTENKIIHFLFKYAEKPEGEKTVYIKMDDLAEIIDDTRLNVSRALNDLHNRRLIELRRKTIYIPEIGQLLDLIK